MKIAPSILSADFGRLAEEVQAAEEAGADWIHVDVMDGHFVPNITLGAAITAAVRRATALPVDVHLMVERPEDHLEAFRDAGADWISVHSEACPHLHRVLERIRELGARPGVALNPATPLGAVEEVIPLMDLLLVMSVNPGFGGQRYIASSTAKLARARKLLDDAGGREVELEVDGGIGPETALEASRAGAGVLVAGSSIFRSPEGVYEALKGLRENLVEPSGHG